MTDNSIPAAIANRAMVPLIALSFFALAIGTAPLTITTLTTLGIWILSGSCWRNRQEWLGSNWLIPLLLLIILPWLGMLWSDAANHKLNFAQRSYYWLFALVAASWLKEEASLLKVIYSYIAAMLLTALIVLLYSFSIINNACFMTGIIQKGYITYSLLLVVAALMLARFFREAGTSQRKIVILIAITTLAVAVTQLSGRSGYLALLLLSPWLFLTMFGIRRMLPVMVATIIIIALTLSSQRVQQRLALIPQEINRYQSGDKSETSVGARLQMWQDGWQVFRNHPILGAGTAGLWHETNQLRPGHGINHPHNSYLYVAANYGIFGILIYGWLLLITLRRAWMARNTLAGHTILSFLIVIMIGSMTDTQLLSLATGIAAGFIVGLPTPDENQCASS